jgi:hypothetical protein
MILSRTSSRAVRGAAKRGAPVRSLLVCLLGLLTAAALAVPVRAEAQGWWGSSAGPGFDPNTVIQVAGKAIQMDITTRRGPSTLRLETPTETFTVMLGPGWYLADLHADIRIGDRLAVEGSKMMDRGGHLHLIASRLVNERTGTVLELRDDMGRPRWMAGHPTGRPTR